MGLEFMDARSIDVSRLVERKVASLYSHLVTRPTGRAVRMAIEARLGGVSRPSVSLIDLSEVTVLDFSCADEVVAKLLLRYRETRSGSETFFIFRGVAEAHREPIEAVLDRQNLAAVAETKPERFELLGTRSAVEHAVWDALERKGVLTFEESRSLFPREVERSVLDRLTERRVALRSGNSGAYHALSGFVSGEGGPRDGGGDG